MKSLSDKIIKIQCFEDDGEDIYQFNFDDVKEFIKELKERGYPAHFCETKKCKCYNENIKENNALIIELEELNKILGDKLI